MKITARHTTILKNFAARDLSAENRGLKAKDNVLSTAANSIKPVKKAIRFDLSALPYGRFIAPVAKIAEAKRHTECFR